ncbi:MAG: LON peptidase substrate-binding domain-containing protein, partial [Planctomycetota bacterium]
MHAADPKDRNDPADPGETDATETGEDAPLRDQTGPTLIIEAEPGGGSMVVKDSVPDTMFVFPLRTAVPFPNLMMPLLLDTPGLRDIVAKAEAHNGYLFLVLQKDAEREPQAAEDLHEVGVVTRILKTLRLPDGGMSSMTQGVRRARLQKIVRNTPHLVARVKEVVDIPAQGPRAESLFRLLQKQLRKLAEMQEQLDTGFATALLNVEDPRQLADFTAGIVRKVGDRQRMLAQADVEHRLDLALQLAMAETELLELDKKIQGEIRDRAEKAQKEYFLREQMKVIRRELGDEKDPRAQEMQRLEQAIEKATMPEVALRRAKEELTRLQTTPVESGEYGVIRNYIDWLTSVPWSVSTTDNSDLDRAARVLADDHYGLEEIKERILESLAVRKLRPGHQGSILCLSGPPGVGKTSLG